MLQLRAIEQCFPMVLFTMLHEVMLTFESIGAPKNLLTCTNERYRAELSCGAVYYAV